MGADAREADGGCTQPSPIRTDRASCNGHTGTRVTKQGTHQPRTVQSGRKCLAGWRLEVAAPRDPDPEGRKSAARRTFVIRPAARAAAAERHGRSRRGDCRSRTLFQTNECRSGWDPSTDCHNALPDGAPDSRQAAGVPVELPECAYPTILRFVGGLGGAKIVNVHVKSAASGLLAVSLTPLAPPLIVARYTAPTLRSTPGSSVTVRVELL